MQLHRSAEESIFGETDHLDIEGASGRAVPPEGDLGCHVPRVAFEAWRHGGIGGQADEGA